MANYPNDDILDEFAEEVAGAVQARKSAGVRIGAELKFPLVNPDGTAASSRKTELLWDYLQEHGWRKDIDPVSGEPSGCRMAGEKNDTVASTETGYSKTEFSMAHEPDLLRLNESVGRVLELLRGFSGKHGVFFLCHGIHPVSPPGRDLMVQKTRTSVWEWVFKSNEHVPESMGDDMHLFTLNAASHVHLGVPAEDMVPLVNALNGFSGAQIALTADSSIWKRAVDPEYKCVSEKFWDWWPAAKTRSGVPEKPFSSFRDYAETVYSFKPVYVKRNGAPLLLPRYSSFREYYCSGKAEGVDLGGRVVPVKPEPGDIKLHNTLYWFNARISGYYTVENRANDQQPEDALLAPSALTLGLASALDEAIEEVCSRDWETLRKTRDEACRTALRNDRVRELSGRMLAVAENGLKKRGLGEEIFLQPLFSRMKTRETPAEEAERFFESGGIRELIERRKL